MDHSVNMTLYVTKEKIRTPLPLFVYSSSGEKIDYTFEVPIKIIEDIANNELKCNICSKVIHNTLTITPCLHRFCSDCLKCHLKVINECPTCSITLTSRRQSRPEVRLDGLIHAISKSLTKKNKEARSLEGIKGDTDLIQGSETFRKKRHVNGERKQQDDDTKPGFTFNERPYKQETNGTSSPPKRQKASRFDNLSKTNESFAEIEAANNVDTADISDFCGADTYIDFESDRLFVDDDEDNNEDKAKHNSPNTIDHHFPVEDSKIITEENIFAHVTSLETKDSVLQSHEKKELKDEEKDAENDDVKSISCGSDHQTPNNDHSTTITISSPDRACWHTLSQFVQSGCYLHCIYHCVMDRNILDRTESIIKRMNRDKIVDKIHCMMYPDLCFYPQHCSVVYMHDNISKVKHYAVTGKLFRDLVAKALRHDPLFSSSEVVNYFLHVLRLRSSKQYAQYQQWQQSQQEGTKPASIITSKASSSSSSSRRRRILLLDCPVIEEVNKEIKQHVVSDRNYPIVHYPLISNLMLKQSFLAHYGHEKLTVQTFRENISSLIIPYYFYIGSKKIWVSIEISAFYDNIQVINYAELEDYSHLIPGIKAKNAIDFLQLDLKLTGWISTQLFSQCTGEGEGARLSSSFLDDVLLGGRKVSFQKFLRVVNVPAGLGRCIYSGERLIAYYDLKTFLPPKAFSKLSSSSSSAASSTKVGYDQVMGSYIKKLVQFLINPLEYFAFEHAK